MATAGVLAVIGLLITIQFPSGTPLLAAVVLGILAIAAWMLFSERYEWSLAILMLYLGLADGFLKLKTGSSYVTLVRDFLLYAIAVGAFARAAVRRQSVRLPPLSGWVIAWLVVVVVQIANPDNGSLLHSLASLRPHVEWVPLFFLGYLTMRSRARIRHFLMLMLAIAAINGIVGLIQLNLTPEQLSAWGPGYQKFISGEGSVSGRTFVDSNGVVHARPFALGGDFGFGGMVGLIAISAAIALLAYTRRRSARIVVVTLAIGAILAIATSEARTAVLGSVIALFAFAALSVTSRTGIKTVLSVGLLVAIAYVTAGALSSNTTQGTLERYNSIAPENALSTAYNYRSQTFAKIPTYVVRYPLGAGIGSAGPATSLGGGGVNTRTLDAESEPTFLLIELGIPGLAVMVAFSATLLYVSMTRIRKVTDRETRLLLTAVAAPLFAIVATGFVGSNTATVPSAPYLWFSAGLLSFWLLSDGGVRHKLVRAPVLQPTI